MEKLVLDEYESQKEQLKSKLSIKFVYSKMDACTRQRHHVKYFAINVKCQVCVKKKLHQNLSYKSH